MITRENWRQGYHRNGDGWCLCTVLDYNQRKVAKELIRRHYPELYVHAHWEGLGTVCYFNDSHSFEEVMEVLNACRS